MPKQKRLSSSQLASQAKKRKRDQRARQHQDTQLEPRDSTGDEKRRRDREAHRQARLDPDRRRLEQQLDTESRRIALTQIQDS